MRGYLLVFFFSSRRRHTRWPRDWSSDVCSSDLTDGVGWAAAAMATPANLQTLLEQGVSRQEIGTAGPGDLFLAVRTADARGADDDAVIDAALRAGERALFAAREHRAGGPTRLPRSLDEAVRSPAGATIAVISVPGEFAALEAHKALALGLDVLLFSDNVSVADEIALKEHAARRGRLVMGPGAGTAMLAGI